MKVIKDYFKKRELEKQKQEEIYRLNLKQEAEQAKKEIKALKEIAKDEKTLEELRKLRTKLKPKPKWSKAINEFMNSISKTQNEIRDANHKLGLDNNKMDDMFKPNIERFVINPPIKTKKKNRIFDI